MKNNNPTLSLCMIVKNEEKFLPRCLESIKGHVDEIIIVDTGSTDSTIEIAKGYNAKIYHHPWENSFSKARNYSLKYATCKWILVLDADEEVDRKNAHKLKDVIKENSVNVIYLPIISRPVGGKNITIANSERLFKNHLGFHYEGIVHNALKHSGLIKKANIKVYHYGYNQDDKIIEKKFRRTSTLLKKQIKNDPKNPIPHHYLASAYLGRKKYDCCVHEALEAIKLFEPQNSNTQSKLLTYYTASAAFYHKKDLVNAEAYALKVINLYPDYVDAYCILSSIYFQRREYGKCTEATKKYLTLLKSIESNPTKALNIPYNTLHHAWSAHSRMAIIHYEQGKEHDGIQPLNNAISCVDNKWEPYLAIGEYFLEQNNLKLAERFLKDGLENSPDSKELLLNLGRLYYLKNNLEMTETLYKKALEIDADYVEALKGMGALYLDMKKFEEARLFLYKVLQKVKDIEVYNNLGCLEDKEGLYERAKLFFEKALELDSENQAIINNLKNVQMKFTKTSDNSPFAKGGEWEFAGSISLCMMVRNEEENLAQCLNSVKDVVDEIIIVDTGSTDRTVEIAKSFGARIFNHPWEGSFSKARNYSLKYATCEWILILDADEEVDKKDTPKLKEITKSNNYETISFVIKNKFENSTQESYANMIRLFKNFNGTHYEGIVHNIIRCRGKRLDSLLNIIHHGYNLSEDEMEEKFVRTTTLLKEQIKRDEHNPVPHMYLGVSYLGKNMYDEAITESKKTLALVKKKTALRDFLVSYYVISAAYLKKKNLKESEKYALKAIEIDDQFIDSFCILSLIYYDSKEYDRFLHASESYLNLWDNITTHPGKSNTFTSHTIGHKWKIHLLLGFYYLSNGQDEKGKFEIDTALKESTEVEYCLKLLGNYHMENNNLDKAEETYKKLLDINETAVDVLVKTGHIKFLKEDMQEAILFWKKAVDIEPTLFDIRLLICKINIVQGKFEDVIADCDKLLHILSIPGNITLEDISDLADLFNIIGEKLKEKHDTQAAETAFNICKDLKQIQSTNTASV